MILELKSFTTCFFALLCGAFLAGAAPAATVNFKMFVDGDDSTFNVIAPGRHTLRVDVLVTDNDLSPGVPGGLLQYAFDLSDMFDSVTWEDVCCSFIGGPDGLWDSTANAAFDSHFQGTVHDGGTDVLAETGSIAPGDYTAQFGDIGAGVWSTIATGAFTYNGVFSHLNLDVANTFGVDIVVAGLEGNSVVGRIPDRVHGDVIYFGICPEPGSLLLAAIGIAFVLGSRGRLAADV